MAGTVRANGEPVRRFILENVESHKTDIAAFTAAHFGISRQAVNKHLVKLREQGALIKEGTSRSSKYRLTNICKQEFSYSLDNKLEEDVIWSKDIRPAIEPLPKNVLNIWHHGFTEMFNNAIDHSDGTRIFVSVTKTAAKTEMSIFDNGIGIFRKIQAEFHLSDQRQAILELSKGKLTTDPKNHSGEGIFFTSRMFDSFQILSGGLYFSHDRQYSDDWLMERDVIDGGTAVFMELSNHTALTTKKVFDQFTSGDDYSFNKTVVPVILARYGEDELVSRSQAKRVLARAEQFQSVILDFKNVEYIGQAFADQIFRVFCQEHPEIEITAINTSKDVKDMINRARAAYRAETQDKD